MSQNIQKQLENVIYGCATPCHSKRADKFNNAIDTAWKIYANTSFDDMLDLAKNLGKFVREHYPEKTRAYQIDRGTIQAYMNSKTARWAQDTFGTNYSRIKKLELCCKHVYFRDKGKFIWDMDNVAVPKSTKPPIHKKNKPIPMEVARVTIADMDENRSRTVNAIKLSMHTGMRVEETTCLKPKNVHLSGGEFGFGWVQIVKGAEGGAKGGRPRRIPLLDKEGHDTLKALIADKKPDDFIVAKLEDGTKLKPDTVDRALCASLKKRHGNTYLYNGCHGLRKTYAQRYYDITREKYDKDTTIAKTNAILGHGYKRGSQGIKTYVKNMH